jgi:hypothetical protein
VNVGDVLAWLWRERHIHARVDRPEVKEKTLAGTFRAQTEQAAIAKALASVGASVLGAGG